MAVLIKKNAAQVRAFEKWAASKDWGRFHHEHYDWWLVPVDAPSSHGWAFSVLPGDIAILRADAAFMASYLRGVELLFQAWGWHVKESRPMTGAEIDDADAQVSAANRSCAGLVHPALADVLTGSLMRMSSALMLL